MSRPHVNSGGFSAEWIFLIVIGLVTVYLLISYTPVKRRNKKKRRKKEKKFSYSGWRIIFTFEAIFSLSKGDYFDINELLKILGECNVFIIAIVNSDDGENDVLKKCSKLIDNGLKKYKILFCETEKGKIAITRQIDPHLYVDNITDKELDQLREHEDETKYFFFFEMSRHIKRLGLLQRQKEEVKEKQIKRNIFIHNSLNGLFKLLDVK